MAERRKIRTPLSQQLNRIRRQLLPVAVFATAFLGAVWLWRTHSGLSSVAGEAEVTRYELTAPVDGILTATPEPLAEFQKVSRGDVLLRLDDRAIRGAIRTVQKQIEQLRDEQALAETQARQVLNEMARDAADLYQEQLVDLRRLGLDIDELRLEILDRQAQIEADTIELRRETERYEAARKLAERGAETQDRVWELEMRAAVISKRLEGNRKALAEAEDQLARARKREKDLAASVEASAERLKTPESRPIIEAYLAPVRSGIAVEEARMQELEVQVRALEVRAPFDGMVREIFRRPGQAVRLGEPVLTLVANESPHVITYVREHHRVGPRIGMPVEVRVRTLPQRIVEGRVVQIGPQVVRVPRQHLRDPQTPEWGLPVRIEFDRKAGIRPGEMVDLTFHPRDFQQD